MKKSDKRRKILTTVLVISLVFIVVGTAYAVTVDKVIAWGAGAWSGTSRIIPSLVKIAGGQAAGNFYRVAFGWPGVAVMATCLAGEYIYNHRNDEGALGDAIRAFLGYIGYRATAGGVEKNEGQIYQPVAGSALATKAEQLRQYMIDNMACTSATVIFYLNAADAAAGRDSYLSNHGAHSVYLFNTYSPGYPQMATVYGAKHNTTDEYANGQGVAHCYPNPGYENQLTGTDKWVSKTPAEMQADAEAKLTDGTQDATEKTLWEELEKIISKALRTNDTATLTKTNTAGKSLEDAIKEKTEAAIKADSTPAEQSSGVIDAILKLTNTLVDQVGLVLTKLMALPGQIASAIGGDIGGTTPPTPPDETPGVTEILTEIGMDDKKTSEKTIMKELLDTITESFDEFRQTITEALQNMVEVSGSCGVFSTTVYGNDFALNFCELDFSALKSGILFIAGLYAFLILLGVV